MSIIEKVTGYVSQTMKDAESQKANLRAEWDAKMNQRAHEYLQDFLGEHSNVPFDQLNLHGMCSFWTRLENEPVPTPCVAHVELIQCRSGGVYVHLARGPSGYRSVVHLKADKTGTIEPIAPRGDGQQGIDPVYNFNFL